jgi:hypothetical protein
LLSVLIFSKPTRVPAGFSFSKSCVSPSSASPSYALRPCACRNPGVAVATRTPARAPCSAASPAAFTAASRRAACSRRPRPRPATSASMARPQPGTLPRCTGRRRSTRPHSRASAPSTPPTRSTPPPPRASGPPCARPRRAHHRDRSRREPLMPLHRGAPRAPKVRWTLRWLELKRSSKLPNLGSSRSGKSKTHRHAHSEKIHRETYTFRTSPYYQIWFRKLENLVNMLFLVEVNTKYRTNLNELCMKNTTPVGTLEHGGPFSALGEPVVFSSMLRILSRGRASATCTHRHTCVSSRWLCVCLLWCCIHSACGDYVRQCCYKIHDPDDENTKCYAGFKHFAGSDYIGGFPKMECCGGSAYKGHAVFGLNLWFWCQTCPECTYVEWEYFEAFQGSRQVCKSLKPCGPGTSGSCEGNCRSCDVGKANPYSDHFCSDCVPGKYAAAQGKLYCDDCAAGYVSGTGWGHCNAC